MQRPAALLLLLLLYITACGQFGISNTEFPNAGDSWKRFYGYLPQNGVGAAGPAQAYDFSNAFYDESDSLKYVPAASTGFLGYHPGSQFAIVDSTWDIHFYYYFAKDNNAFWETGLTMVGDFGNGPDTLHGNHVAPVLADTLLSNQYTYGHIETEVSLDTLMVNPFIKVRYWEYKVINVDGWGSLATPFDIYDTVLRVHTITYKFDSLFINNLFDDAGYDTLYTYDYYAKDIRQPVVRAHTNAADSVYYFELIRVPPLIYGCTDQAALNYNPLANVDDSSCIYCQAVNYTITSDTAICPGDSVTLVINGGVIWGWNTGDSTSTITVAPDSDKVYSVFFADSVPCWEQASVLVEVDHPVTAAFWTQDQWYPIEDSVQFVNLSQEADQYSWDFDDNSATSTLENPKHLFSTTGNKNIMLIASNSCSVDTAFMQLMVAPTGITPVDNSVATVKVFPNPGTEDATISIELKMNTEISVAIYDLMGRKAGAIQQQGLVGGNNLSITAIAPLLQPGIYFINAVVEGQTYLTKWIKL